MWRNDSLEKTLSWERLKAGEGNDRAAEDDRLDGHEFEQAPGVVMDSEAWRAAVHGVSKSQSRLSNWTELNWTERLRGWLAFFFFFSTNVFFNWASQFDSVVKNPPATQETWSRHLGQEDPLDKEIATTLVFLPGKSQGRRSLVGYSPWGCWIVRHNLVTK